jgi:hypothetical protein
MTTAKHQILIIGGGVVIEASRGDAAVVVTSFPT